MTVKTAKPKFLPLDIVTQMFDLTVDQVQAVIKAGGGDYKVTKVTCLGLQPGGHFVYSCEGENLAPHISTFKIKVAIDPKWDAMVRPEYRDQVAQRVLNDCFVLYWA